MNTSEQLINTPNLVLLLIVKYLGVREKDVAVMDQVSDKDDLPLIRMCLTLEEQQNQIST